MQGLREDVLVLPDRLIQLLSLLQTLLEVTVLALKISNQTYLELVFLNHLNELSLTVPQLTLKIVDFCLLATNGLRHSANLGQ